MANLDEARVLLEEGWKAREALDLDTARIKLQESQQVFEETGEFQLVTESLNHQAYTEKLDAGQHAVLALELAMKSEQIAVEHGVDPVLTYRAVMSTAETAGLFELALQYANKMLPLLDKPILKGDLMSHIATFEMRTGNITKASQSIEQALSLLEEGWETEREPHRTIWKLRALCTKAIIKSNMGEKDEAKNLLENAKRIAENNDLKPRLKQIETLIKHL